jgi:dihydrofolate synthase/folylpolyglutamate synthase
MDRSTVILERLLSLHPKEIDLSLERVDRLAAALGRPERRLPPVIHVAGTNGKGSTTAFMRAMLEAAGKRVHVYTSPHLVRFHERIRVAGRLVDEDELAEALLHVERVNAGAPITQFEITTAAAFHIFATHPADVTLLEVGLGGRLDATNIVAEPLAAAITPISLDHEKHLGDTLELIAAEKAGIIKPGRPVVVSAQPSAAMAVIERRAARLRAPLHAAGAEWLAHPEHGRLVYQDEGGLLDLPPPRLVGRHQYGNAGTAIATLHQAGLGLPASAIEAGLGSVEWPARMQLLAGGRLAALLPDGEIWLDGGHNPGAGAVIAETMADLEERVPRPLVLIAGMLNTKDPVGFFQPFAGLARHVITVPVESSQAGRDPAELAEAARAAGLPAEPAGSVPQALGLVAHGRHYEAPPRVLICGSLYLAGTVLADNGTPPR